MSRLHVNLAYVNHREDYPESVLTYAALKGFALMGVETRPFYLWDELDELELSSETIVCGYVGDVRHALKVMGLPDPPTIDYPDSLWGHLGREVWRSNVETVLGSTETLFVKPYDRQKLFTGFVKGPAFTDKIRLSTVPLEAEVWVSEPMEFITEYRTFLMRGVPVGIKHYKGDPFVTPDRYTVESMVRAWYDQPAACTIDVGVTRDGRTLLIECNDGFAFGNYGLAEITYARMLEARWRQLTGAPLPPPPHETPGWPTREAQGDP